MTVIHTTTSHPFWDQTTHGWVRAEMLSVGDALRTFHGAKAVVLGGNTRRAQSGWMWDLTVTGTHDFYIQATYRADAVLVHNCAAVRFAVDANGEVTMFLRAGSESLEVTEHAALRLIQRGISIDQAEAVLGEEPFQYFYKGGWRTGYYDPASHIFIGSVDGRITTVIRNASQNYINNLKAASPP